MKTGGYTFVELLTSLAIAGVLASVALPSLDTLAMNERRTAVVNNLVATLMLARSEALKRGGRPLVVCGIVDGNRDGIFDPAEQRCAGHDWTDGWILASWNDADGNATVGPDELVALRVFQVPASGQLTVTAGNFTASPPVGPPGTILVKAFGRRTSNGTVTVCDRRGPAAARAVIVPSLGHARVSSSRADGTPLRCP